MDVNVEYTGHPTGVAIELPLSKSVVARELLLEALTGRPLPAAGENWCADLRHLRDALYCAGAGASEINVGESGTAMRMLAAYLSYLPGEWLLTGKRSLLIRPMQPLIESLRRLGADIESCAEGLRISGGKLRGGEVSIDASESSQYVSALMLTGAFLPGGLRIHITGRRVSWSYIAMTAEVMRRSGLSADISADHTYIYVSASGHPFATSCSERDWSAASYFFEVAALTGTHIPLPGLRSGLQGDSRAAELFRPLGVDYTDGILTPAAQIHPAEINIDMGDVPDLVPAYSATLCGLGIPFRISGIGHLRHKESDRLDTLSSELRHVGFHVECDTDTLHWQGTRCPADRQINSHGDHRIVMAMAPLARIAPLRIAGAEDVAKSFPHYFTELKKCGFRL